MIIKIMMQPEMISILHQRVYKQLIKLYCAIATEQVRVAVSIGNIKFAKTIVDDLCLALFVCMMCLFLCNI